MHKISGKYDFIIVLTLTIVLSFAVSCFAKDGAVEIDGQWIGMNWPLSGEGRQSSAYGKRNDPILGIVRAHGGIDVAAPSGTPVLAALGGRVSKAGNGGDLGKHIFIVHSNGRETVYGHLSEIKVKAGQFVSPRQTIGKVGSTGRSTGPHLHFAVKLNGRYVDPEKWMVPTGFLKK